MTDYDHGPLVTYEVVWTNGHTERIQAHQVTMPGSAFQFGLPTAPRWLFHGEINGKWQLILCVPDDEIRYVRNVTATEADLL